MGASVESKSKILFIVEGEVDESVYFKRLASCFGINFEIVSFSTNIYTLYKDLKKLSFDADIVDVLRTSKTVKAKDIEKLNQNYAYIYLIFDFDVQHGLKGGKTDWHGIKCNIKKISEMAHHFTNESDPSIGKLYINFPMYEALFHVLEPSNPFEPRYCETSKICSYKEAIRNGVPLPEAAGKLAKSDFIVAAGEALRILSFLFNQNSEPLAYSDYLQCASMEEIVKKESQLVITPGNPRDSRILVFPTAAFFLLDYYGDQNGFYSSVVRKFKK